MPEIGTSGLMSGDGKRGDALRQRSRPSSTLPVPTATFRVLFVLVVLSHDRRRVLHFNVTDHPSEEWTAQQMREAFPWEAPKYLIRDRDAIFGCASTAQVTSGGRTHPRRLL